MSTPNASAAWLTKDTYDRLNAELEELSGSGRAEVVKRIEAARSEGDLKENGGYHAAKEEQGKIEGRIAQLTELLRNAQVGEAPKDDGVVEAGMFVVANIAGKETKFLLGSRESAAESNVDVFSVNSALGAAIDGHKVGDKLSYTAPNGKDIAVEIVSAKPYQS